MRRTFQAFVVAILVGAGTQAALAVCGDANGDGRVTVSDGVQALRAAADLSSLCEQDCDIDGDGDISVTDGVNVLRKAAGLTIVEACPDDGDRVASVIGHTVDIFGPLTKVGAFGATPAGSASPCDNSEGGFQQSESGITFDNCSIDGVAFTGFLATGGGSLGFDGLSIARRGDVLSLAGTLSVGDVQGNPQLFGVLNGNSTVVGPYVITFQGVVSGGLGQTLDGVLVFDTSEADLDGVAEIRVTLTGGTILPVLVTYLDDTTANFTYDTDADELTPADPTPTPTATPVARVRLSNIDDRITAFLNGKQVLQAQSGPNGTNDTGFQEVDGLQCGDNLFEFRVENLVPGSGYTFRVELEVDGTIISSRSCGQAGFQGCDNDNNTQGEVARDVTFFCLPCGPCTAGAGTCDAPLQIPASGRLQVHGRTSGANTVSGPCDGGGGPESVFRFTPPANGCYEFSSCGTSFDSQLSLGDDLCPGQSGPLQETCYDDNSSCGDDSTHEANFGFFLANQPVTFLLDSEGSQGGGYIFDIRPSGQCIF